MLEKPFCTRSRNIVKISTALLFFTLLLSITTPGDGEINDNTSAKDITFHEEIIRTLAETGNSPKMCFAGKKNTPTHRFDF